MTADEMVRAVREQVGLGRLLPLGGAADGAWVAERAAAAVLGTAGGAVPGVLLDRVRIGMADPGAHDWGAVRAAHPDAPAGALPAGPLRVEGWLRARPDRPLPATAAELRALLADAADRLLGLAVVEVDLRVTGLLGDDPPYPAEPGASTPEPSAAGPGSREPGTAEPASGRRPDVGRVSVQHGDRPDRAGRPVPEAVWEVPGVLRAARPPGGPDGRLLVGVRAGHRVLDVALAVRRAADAGAVVVTEVG